MLGIALFELQPVEEEIGYWKAVHITAIQEREITIRPCSGQLANDIEAYYKPRSIYPVNGNNFKCLNDPNRDLYLQS